MQNQLSFFIAGTMQGSSAGVELIDQAYRSQIRAAIEASYPNVIICCPYQIMVERFAQKRDQVTDAFNAVSKADIAFAQQYNAATAEVVQTFHDLVRMAGEADVLVAHLPGHQASMGTAVEMWNAHANGKVVITISLMRQNLAVVATSSAIVPSVEAFSKLLADGYLNGYLERGTQSRG